jgi:hypothetical protein
MKTIRQIADELGVSKQAIFKKIDNLGLRQRLTKVNNQWLIDESIEITIKEAFSTTSRSSTYSSTDSSTVDRLIDVLKMELNVKNEQIADLQKLLDQEQQLRMVTEQKLLLLEEKSEEDEQNQQPKEDYASSQKKVSFWNWLWNKGN